MAYKDPEKQRASHRAYRAAHREERLAYHRAYYAAHREERRVRDRAYRAAHREERLAYGRAYRAAHREEKLARDRAYRMSMAGEIIYIPSLPPEAQKVAFLLRELRRAMKEKQRGQGNAGRASGTHPGGASSNPV